MGSRRPTPDNISFPRGDNRPQPPRPTPQPPRPQPPRPTPQPPRPPITPSGPVTPATGITSPPQIDRRPPTPSGPVPPKTGGFFGPGGPMFPPTTPSGPVKPKTGITSPPQIDRRGPDRRPPIPQPPVSTPIRRGDDRRPPTGFFGPGKDYRVGPTGPDGQRPRRMAAAPPVVIERTTVERRTPSRPPVRDDFQPRSRDEFEGYRRGPRKEVNIAKQDI